METPTPDIGELRKFSKEHSSEERKQVTADIKEQRSKYFSEQGSLAEQIKKLEAEAANQESRSGDITEKIDALRQGISQKESNWLSKVVNFFELKKLRQELGARELTAKKLSERMAETGMVMNDLQELIQDKGLLKKARQRLLDFKGEQTEAWREYKENETKRDVKNIMREQDVVFIHGTHPSFVPEANSI
jgi:chromosome segregation ATPase